MASRACSYAGGWSYGNYHLQCDWSWVHCQAATYGIGRKSPSGEGRAGGRVVPCDRTWYAKQECWERLSCRCGRRRPPEDLQETGPSASEAHGQAAQVAHKTRHHHQCNGCLPFCLLVACLGGPGTITSTAEGDIMPDRPLSTVGDMTLREGELCAMGGEGRGRG